MHALREAVLLRSVQALIARRRLTLTDVARAWPGAECVAAPLKTFDRLLSNGQLHRQRERNSESRSQIAPLHRQVHCRVGR
jgi:hypothetical protein